MTATIANQSWHPDAILADGGVELPEQFPFRAALEIYAGALDREAMLTPSGRIAVRGSLVGAVAETRALDDVVARHPEIADVAVERPLIITGLLRTGTTLVHNLLAEHPDLRAPALWELMFPASPAATRADRERLADTAQGYVEDYYRVAPALPSIHFLDARRPDECHRLLGNTFQSMVYEMRYRVPSYGKWLAQQDLTEAYLRHRRQLQAILWRLPARQVVLKCPFHLWSMAELIRVYPDARIVHMHRDPVETIPSTCSLCATIRGGRTNHIDRAEIGRQWLDRITGVMAHLDPAGRPVPKDQVLDVRHSDLVMDPRATLARICDFAGVPLTDLAWERISRYLDANGRTKHGTHHYAVADFDLDETEINRRFADYCMRFNLR